MSKYPYKFPGVVIICEACGQSIKPVTTLRLSAAHHFCNKACRGKWMHEHRDQWKSYLPEQGTAENNTNWKGDAVGAGEGRNRARRWFAAQPCEVCGSTKSERHHVDGNTKNNAPGNIRFLCRRHHMEVDGRLAAFIENYGGEH